MVSKDRIFNQKFCSLIEKQSPLTTFVTSNWQCASYCCYLLFLSTSIIGCSRGRLFFKVILMARSECRVKDGFESCRETNGINNRFICAAIMFHLHKWMKNKTKNFWFACVYKCFRKHHQRSAAAAGRGWESAQRNQHAEWRINAEATVPQLVFWWGIVHNYHKY